jgi:MFS family permease
MWKGRESALADRTGNISSFGVLGAAFGSLIAIFLNDRIGRLKTYRLAILVWAIGILMQIFSSGIYGFILFARIFGGLGAGCLTVTAPLVLAEIATAKNRGLMVSLYMVVLLTFLTLGKLRNT